ncbi:MAG: sugar-binding domain-containing protein [Bowdeniella nasicola]|nr:sugar-binding domain-containing protein [Bowdeniella nasicola]
MPDQSDDATERQLIAQIARRFYLEDDSKVAIARDTGLSRFKVARLLASAREQGIVRIEILEPTTDLPMFSAPLARHLGLHAARVIDSIGSRAEVRAQLGAMGAQYLSERIEPGETFGMSWGRTMVEVARHLPAIEMVTAVQLSGTVREIGPQSPIETIRERIEARGGSAHPIYDPLYVGESAERQRRIAGLNYVLGLFEHLNTAVLSIGSWNPPTTQLRAQIPPILRARLDESQPAAELAGIWLGADGTVMCPEITRQCITVATHHLLNTPEVLVVAGGEDKAEAIAACARSGLITSLVTDRVTAERLLAGKAVRRTALTRPHPPRS